MENPNSRFHGVITAIVTPFKKADGGIDEDGLKELIEFQVANGVQGVYPIGTTGEGLLLLEKEKHHVIERVLDYSRGRLLVIPQVGCVTQEETTRLALYAMKAGVDAVGLLPPFFYSIPADSMVRYFVSIANRISPLPAFLYNIPANAKNDITPSIVQRVVAEAPNVIGIKDTSKDVDRFEAYISTMGTEFRTIVGADSLFFPSLTVGGCGTVTAAGNAYPELFVSLYNAYKLGDWEKAKNYQYQINRVRAIMHEGPQISTYKAVLRMKGLSIQGTRQPIRDLLPDEYQKMYTKLMAINMV
ncbi:MAG: dihydrodipicolinate synthase family protein [Anaerolineaceae bacterium]